MSQSADLVRDARKGWAVAGSAHDRLIRLLQILLPAAVGALTAILVFAPFGERGEISFLLSKDKIDIAGQRLRVERANYRGADNNGQPFVLSAVDAIQRSAADPIVRMRGLTAAIVLSDGPATLRAAEGDYDPASDQIGMAGPVQFDAADGYRLATADVRFDLKRRFLSSVQPVAGDLPIGRFAADRLSADLQARVIQLNGNAHLHINQGVVR